MLRITTFVGSLCFHKDGYHFSHAKTASSFTFDLCLDCAVGGLISSFRFSPSTTRRRMVFFSSYKASRVLARDFLKPQVDRHRAIGEYILLRSWSGTLFGLLAGDCRWFLFIGFNAYYIQRLMHTDKITEDETQRTIINRWGGTVEAVRQNLTPADLARARAYYHLETYGGPLAPTDLFKKPEGCPLPGPVALPGRPAAH